MNKGMPMGSLRAPDIKGAIETIIKNQIPLNTSKDLDPLLTAIGNAKYVLLGDASHGTFEYYRWRAALSRRLIEEKGFRFIAVEGDWADCFEANRHVKDSKEKRKITDILIENFTEWPTWVWSNWEITELLDWMRSYNANLPPQKQVGFYGLDVFALYKSLERVYDYVKKLDDPELKEIVDSTYTCFQAYGNNPEKYGRAASKKSITEGCGKQVTKLLSLMRKKYEGNVKQENGMADEEAFSALMNARVLAGAENYYKATSGDSWNIRDTHMADQLDALMNFHGPEAKCIVWVHNNHAGDTQYTGWAGKTSTNLGQIVRERHGKDGVFLMGSGTNEGTAIASDNWGAPWDRKVLPPAPINSWEYLLREADGEKVPNKLLIFSQMKPEDRKVFEVAREHRSIAVVYDPVHKKYSDWIPTVLGKRYDAFWYFDRTTALHPLPEKVSQSMKPPQGYPWGLVK